MKNMKNTSR